MMIDIIIAGEDLVTQEIARRILNYSVARFNITRVEPVRGAEIKNKILNYNRLNLPVCILTDLDNANCPPSLIQDWFKGQEINPNLIFNIACDEAEAWLMADKRSFSKFLGIKEEDIPGIKKVDRRNPNNIELDFKYKPSLFMMRELLPKSNNKNLADKLRPREGAKKGPEYNSTLIPFIRNEWDISLAKQNSYSLQKALKRIASFQNH